MRSLQARKDKLSDPYYQLEVLEDIPQKGQGHPRFQDKLKALGIYPLHPARMEVMQVNVGYMCNQTCSHCHVDAGPDRKEIMTRETMQHCLDAVDNSHISTVDLTGGAPEMNPDFRWFVEQLSLRGVYIIVRCNLTIIVANKKYNDLPEFFKEHKLEVISSLPYYSERKTDSQRGEGVFERSVKALQMLNDVGYGREDGLKLNLVYNPSGAFLPAPQEALEKDFKRQLKEKYDIDFHHLYTITNLPISRFLDYLIRSENYDNYMEKLVNAFNPAAAKKVMCRDTISVGWDGNLYDCDFNQMLDMKVESEPRHISAFNKEKLEERSIKVGQHCYGCTAGAGSSCGGTIA